MGRLREGTFVDLDKNFGNICVGDHVRDADGNIYKIDSYGRAVSKKDKSIHAIKSLKEPTYYAVHEDKETVEKTAPVEAPAEAAAEKDADTSLADNAIRFAKRARKEARTPRKRKEPRSKEPASAQVTLAEATDQMLADELRRRGYKLSAKKTVNIKL